MFCPKCGNEIDESQGYNFCPKCSQSLSDNAPIKKVNENKGDSKQTAGLLLALFLNLIGLIIGVCMYPSDSYERKTFMDGWLIGFCVNIGLWVISAFFLVLLSSFICLNL